MKMSTTLDTNKQNFCLSFAESEKRVKKLQKRIGEAYKNNDIELVAYLQHCLIHSRCAKELAVKSVMIKSGRKYPGIDNVTWADFQEGLDEILPLKPSTYKPMPLKRIYFKKSNGQTRPIGIPTLKDRAMQTLFKFALEPISEICADDSSFAYRKNRSAKDAINRICNILYNYPEFEYALKVDIRSCFDSISHKWLLDNIPFDKKILYELLKCGYIDKDKLYKSERGIPQGGCLSSVLCNMTLDGIEGLLEGHFEHAVKIVRYADDIVIFVSSLSRAKEVLSVLRKFLKDRALELSKEKTLFVPLTEGFDFLGYHIARKNNLVTCLPAKGKKEKYLSSIEDALNQNPYTSTKEMYKIISPRIRGWFNYYMGIVPSYYLYEIEFDTIMCINSLTDNTALVAVINKKIFSKYTYIS